MSPTWFFLRVNAISDCQLFLDFYHQSLLLYDFEQIDSVFCDLDIVGNKPKGRISKREFQVSKAQQIFRKTNIYYHLIRTRTYVHVRIREMFVFQNIWRALFSWNSRFEIRIFALLPTILRSIKHWSHETRIQIIQCFSHFSC